MVQSQNRVIQRGEQMPPGHGDVGPYHTPIRLIARSLDEPAFFQPVQQPGHVRIVREHPLGDLPAGKAFVAPYPGKLTLRAGSDNRLPSIQSNAKAALRVCPFLAGANS